MKNLQFFIPQFLGHLSHSGDLLLWVGVRRRPLTSSPQKLLGQSLPNMVCSIIRGGRPEIVNFMTPGAGVLALGRSCIRHIVKMNYFFKNLLLYSQV